LDRFKRSGDVGYIMSDRYEVQGHGQMICCRGEKIRMRGEKGGKMWDTEEGERS
jgi:hypothetical protein